MCETHSTLDVTKRRLETGKDKGIYHRAANRGTRVEAPSFSMCQFDPHKGRGELAPAACSPHLLGKMFSFGAIM